LATDALVKCPKCEQQFRVPPEEEEDLPAPPRRSRPDDLDPEDPEERPRVSRRRDDDDPDERFGPEPRRSRAFDDLDDRDERPRWRRDSDEDEDEDYPRDRRGRPYGNVADLSTRYEVDLSRWFSIGKEHWGDILGPSAGFLLILGVAYVFSSIAGAIIPFAGVVYALFLQPHLLAGLTLVCLAQLKGEKWSFGDFFGGFQWYGHILALTLLVGLAELVVMLPVGIAMIVFFVSGGPPWGLAVVIPLILVTAVAAVYLGIRLQFYALPLMLDRNFGVIDAIAGSWKLTQGHVLMLFVVSLLVFAINFVGALPCGLGLLFTTPLTQLIVTAGYLLVAGSQPPVSRGDDDYEGDRGRRRRADDDDDYDDRPRRRRPREEDDY
jgi:hypothetical protein